jgi:glycosyltransferase involved in cell wall biosynthesis
MRFPVRAMDNARRQNVDVSERTNGSTLPLVSVVIPMRNERQFIETCLDGFDKQTWPKESLEVLVVDGGSTDGSKQIVSELAARLPWLRTIDNPDGRASAAFNRGIDAATGEVICLFSSHGVPASNYIERSVKALEDTGAAGVGGRIEHTGTDPSSEAIGLAMTSQFGMASQFRFANVATEIDTIGHPAYRREALLSVGSFDESLERNSDYELNWRLRARGERLIFEPAISSVYRPRPGLGALARQFWSYGRWKAEVIRRNPRSARPRHLAAPALAAGVVIAPVAARWRPGRIVLVLGVVLYVVGLIVASTRARKRSVSDVDTPVLVVAFPVMHLSWGFGFLASLFRRPRPRVG